MPVGRLSPELADFLYRGFMAIFGAIVEFWPE